MKKTNENRPIGIKYAEDVVSGKIVAGEFIKLACKRFLSDLERDDLYFDVARVNRCIKFIQCLKHFVGKSAGKPFVLEPWQNFIICNVVGLLWKETRLRKYRTVYIEIARKNGKTAFASALSLYFMIADGESGAEVEFCANSKQQAKIAFSMAQQFCKQLDPKGKDLHVLRDTIELDATASKMQVFSSDDSKLDGFNASFFIQDEYHAAKTSKVYDVLRSSQGMRSQPIACIITTAGFLIDGPCYKMRQTAIEVLKGLKEDESNFSAIYTLDNESEIYDENCWIKANPNLGVTATKEYLREMVQTAKNNPSEYVSTATKLFNQWLSSSDIWIAENYITDVSATVNFEDFTETETIIGFDLGAVSDITAVSFLMTKDDDDLLYLKTKYYLPESALIESPNRELYKWWKRQKLLTITSGNVTDYDYIINDIMKAYNTQTIIKIAYDDWNSTQAVIAMTELGLPLEPYSQSIGNFNKPTKEFERLVKQKKIVIDNNEITRWMLRNVALKTDHNGNTKPTKGCGKDKKIDGVIAMLTALGKYLETPHFKGEIFVV